MANKVYGTLDLKPKSVEEQLKKLRKIFPNVKFGENVSEVREGFVLPLYEKIAPNYLKALEKVFDKIDDLSGMDFVNCQTNKDGSQTLQTNEDTVRLIEGMQSAQGNSNYIITDAQLGKLNLGKSVEEVLLNLSNGVHFGLSAFHVGIIILTHFDRVAGGDDLWINCPGDSLAICAKGELIHSPFFTVTSKKIWFCTHSKVCVVERFGSATTV